MPRSPSLPGSRNLVILASALTAFTLLASSGALASGPMPMDPPAQQSNPNGGSGQSGTGSAGQPGGAGGQGSNSAPGQSAQPGTAANSAPKAAVSAPTKKTAAPAQGTGSAPVRSSQTGGTIETIVQLPQPTAKLEAGPAPTGLSSGEPTDSLIEVASTAQPGTFPYATVALGLGVLALVVLLAPSFRGMPRPAVSSAADPV